MQAYVKNGGANTTRITTAAIHTTKQLRKNTGIACKNLVNLDGVGFCPQKESVGMYCFKNQILRKIAKSFVVVQLLLR